MAGGITSTALVSEASNHGALGMIGAGYMSAANLHQQIKEIKHRTNKPFGVNVFVPSTIESEKATENHARKVLQPYYDTYQIDESSIQVTDHNTQKEIYAQQLQVIIEASVPVVSFTFGMPSAKVMESLKNANITIIGTAETVDEALQLEESGMDMIVMQGSEAGGHRGGFKQSASDQSIGLMALLPQAANTLSIPIIGSGGIMDGSGLVAARALGASGVQMGTAFLLTEESSAHPLHKKAITTSKEHDTIITTAFSGKPARGIRNAFINKLQKHESSLPAYPMMNQLTQPIRNAAKNNYHDEAMSLWSGQGTRLGNIQSTAQLLETIIKEACIITTQLGKDE